MSLWYLAAASRYTAFVGSVVLIVSSTVISAEYRRDTTSALSALKIRVARNVLSSRARTLANPYPTIKL